MTQRLYEFVGGPMDGERHATPYPVLHELVIAMHSSLPSATWRAVNAPIPDVSPRIRAGVYRPNEDGTLLVWAGER